MKRYFRHVVLGCLLLGVLMQNASGQKQLTIEMSPAPEVPAAQAKITEGFIIPSINSFPKPYGNLSDYANSHNYGRSGLANALRENGLGSYATSIFAVGTVGGKNNFIASAALPAAPNASSYTLPMLASTPNGNWNPFWGPKPYPYTGYSNFTSPLNTGQSYNPAASSFLLTVVGMGYGNSSPFGPGALVQNALSPWFSSGGGFLSKSISRKLQKPAATQRTRLQNLEARYNDLEEMQLDIFFVDPALSQLRAEYNAVQLSFIYADPWVAYYRRELIPWLESIYRTRPTYPTLENLATEIRSWTNPPNNITVLKDRYAKRLLLLRLYSQVQAEVAYYFWFFPAEAQKANTLLSFLSNRLAALYQLQDVQAWFQSWVARWQVAFDVSSGNIALEREIDDILNEFPEYEEYLELLEDASSEIPAVANISAVTAAGNELDAVLQNRDVAEEISALYAGYSARVELFLNSTDYTAEIERYLERLNGLILSHRDYPALRNAEIVNLSNLDILERDVHAAVVSCINSLGQFCNPFQNAAVRNVLPNPNINNGRYPFLQQAGRFYEDYNTFWYAFYTSADYRALENEFIARLQNALTPVLPSLENAQADFVSDIQSIPEVRSLKTAINSVASALRNASGSLDATLEEMADLVNELNDIDPPGDRTGYVYWSTSLSGKIQRAFIGSDQREDVLTNVKPEFLVVDARNRHLLWTEGSAGKIMRADLDGRNRVELITGLDYPTAIALDDAAGKLYWAHESDDGIKRADLGGSNIETVISSNYEFGYGIAVDSKNGKLFWTEGNDDKIQSANLDGSRVRTLFSGLEFPIAIDVDPNSNRIFWSETDDPEGIYTATSNGSGRRFLIGPYADDLVVDAEDGRIYWPDDANDRIVRAKLDGTGLETVARTGSRRDRPVALALYFTLTTDVAEIERLPEHFVLHQNYPNPFNPVTAFRFELPQPSHVRLHIYTIHGQQVATVADASYSAGVHTLSWDASQQASGVYFYRIEIDEQAPGGRKRTQTRKLMVLK